MARHRAHLPTIHPELELGARGGRHGELQPAISSKLEQVNRLSREAFPELASTRNTAKRVHNTTHQPLHGSDLDQSDSSFAHDAVPSTSLFCSTREAIPESPIQRRWRAKDNCKRCSLSANRIMNPTGAPQVLLDAHRRHTRHGHSGHTSSVLVERSTPTDNCKRSRQPKLWPPALWMPSRRW